MRHNATTSEELTVVQIQCVQTLMTGATITDAAKTTGIDRATIYRWASAPDFGGEVESPRRQAIDWSTKRNLE